MSGMSGMSERAQGAVGASLLAGLLFAASCAAPPPAPAGEVLGQLVIDGVPRDAIGTGRAPGCPTRTPARRGSWAGWGTAFSSVRVSATRRSCIGWRNRSACAGRSPSSRNRSRPQRSARTPTRAASLYVKDIGGSEFYQFFWLDLATRESTLLTDGRSRYSNIVWAASGPSLRVHDDRAQRRRLATSTFGRSGATRRRVRSPVALEGRGVGWTAEDWSPDETRMLVRRYVAIDESYLHEVDLGVGERAGDCSRTSVRASIVAARYEADGERVLFTSDLGGEFVGLAPARSRHGRRANAQRRTSPGTWKPSPCREIAGGSRSTDQRGRRRQAPCTRVARPRTRGPARAAGRHRPLRLSSVRPGHALGVRGEPRGGPGGQSTAWTSRAGA